MKLTVEFHGVLRRLAGADTQQLELPEGASAAAALDALNGPPELHQRLENCACAIGDRLVARTEILSEGETLVLIPPVSGG